MIILWPRVLVCMSTFVNVSDDVKYILSDTLETKKIPYCLLVLSLFWFLLARFLKSDCLSIHPQFQIGFPSEISDGVYYFGFVTLDSFFNWNRCH